MTKPHRFNGLWHPGTLGLMLAAAFAAAALAQTGDPVGPAKRPAPEWLGAAFHGCARVIEVVGVACIVIGAIAATVFALKEFARSGPSDRLYEAYRASLGRAILLGLEFLVAADIIGTVAVTPSLYNLGVLAVIVLIRTFLSFSLETEIQGRWPWRRNPPGQTEDRARQV